ncbi:hypothetical protein [Chromobacterium haemolyticum]|uniref:hypothetical protein n=1 Tax=Chromobacterium haemolyticum TaxID=394935 RepID=UPI00307D2526
MTSQQVAALFVRTDSVYKQMVGVDAWDAERDAMAWPGGCPVVAHPPCRAWGRLRHMANPRPGERELALWVVDQIREYGGVLEHPASSLLWKEKPLPEPGQTDAWGGLDSGRIAMVVGTQGREGHPTIHLRSHAGGTAPDSIPHWRILACHRTEQPAAKAATAA